MNRLRITLVLVLLVFCSSWGFLVHRTVNQLAIYELPKAMRPFFYKNLDSIVEEAIRPDQRRNQDPKEAPKHFIDIEMYGDSALWKMPLTWDDAVKKYSKDTLFKYGYVPYHVIAMKNHLIDAFRSGNADSIVFYATDLGHYIGDANVPLHTTTNYDGQLTNQKGLHWLWESGVPNLQLEQYKLTDHHKATYLSHPEEAIWNAVRHTYGLLNDIFEKEKEVSKQFTPETKYIMEKKYGRDVRSYSPAFAKVYAESLQPTVNDQLIRSSNLIADFWYTAWVDAGRPDLTSLLKNGFTKKDRKALKLELKAYRKNDLIEKKMLVARRFSGSD